MILSGRYTQSFLLLLLILTGISLATATARHPYSVTRFMQQTRLKKKSLQGMDIIQNRIFVMQDGGFCRVYDYRTKLLLDSFPLASCRPGNHCNTANFGIEKAKGSSLPVMYVSVGKPGDTDEYACYVESFTCHKGHYQANLVQTIRMDQSGFRQKGWQSIWGCPNWVIDKERRHLWAFSAVKRTIVKETGPFHNNKYVATKFRLPLLKEGKEVILTAHDVLDQAVMEFDAYVTQGGTMKDGKIYYVFGFGKEGTRTPAKMRIYDTDSRTILARWNLEDIVKEEPEDVAVYQGRIYMNTNSPTIYVLDPLP